MNITWYSSYSLSLICLFTLNKSFCQSNCLCVLWCDINCWAWRVGYCVLRTPTRVSCHTIPPGLITSSKSVKSNQTMIYPERSGSGDSHCDNINHAPAGTRRPVQDRPISSDINIPAIMEMSPPSGHCSPHDQGQYFKCNEFIFYLTGIRKEGQLFLSLGLSLWTITR